MAIIVENQLQIYCFKVLNCALACVTIILSGGNTLATINRIASALPILCITKLNQNCIRLSCEERVGII